MSLLSPGVLASTDAELITPAEITKVIQNSISATLIERGARYGKFTGHAEITQSFKQVMHTAKNWPILSNDQKESLEMIAHKIGRILNGDPNYDDSWIDIAGYAKLVGDRLTNGTEV
jgi:hypothetical protein